MGATENLDGLFLLIFSALSIIFRLNQRKPFFTYAVPPRNNTGKIVPNIRKNCIIAYRARAVIKRDGRIAYCETRTFERKAAMYVSSKERCDPLETLGQQLVANRKTIRASKEATELAIGLGLAPLANGGGV